AFKAFLLALIPAGQAFSGLGQIRTLYIARDHDDLGCLTSQGKWTTDEALCGNFYAYRLSKNAKGMSTFRLAGVDVGMCGITPAGIFKCGGVHDAEFGTWGYEGPVKQHDVLRYGQYGVVASDGNNPPALNEGPNEVHFYSGSEKGKYVWLVWKWLED
ncbi:hypothetical protein QBC38DRAFT_333836, partial [Podospora fimiseda]